MEPESADGRKSSEIKTILTEEPHRIESNKLVFGKRFIIFPLLKVMITEEIQRSGPISNYLN